MPVARPGLRHISLYEPLGDKLVPGRYNKSGLVSELQDEYECISLENWAPKFHKKMTFASPASQKIRGLKTAFISATIYNDHIQLL